MLNFRGYSGQFFPLSGFLASCGCGLKRYFAGFSRGVCFLIDF